MTSYPDDPIIALIHLIGMPFAWVPVKRSLGEDGLVPWWLSLVLCYCWPIVIPYLVFDWARIRWDERAFRRHEAAEFPSARAKRRGSKR